jgi:hypothetical protein
MQVFATKLILLSKKATNHNHQGLLKVIQHALTATKLKELMAIDIDFNQIIQLIGMQ